MRHTIFLVGLASTSLTLAACTPADKVDKAETPGAVVDPNMGGTQPVGGGVPDASQPDVPPNPDGTNPIPPSVGGNMDTKN